MNDTSEWTREFARADYLEISSTLGIGLVVAQQINADSSHSVELSVSTDSLPPVGTRATLSFGIGRMIGDFQKLSRLGPYGWRVVGYSGTKNWTVEFDGRQWEYETTKRNKIPRGDGWEIVRKFGFFCLWVRPTDLPVLPGNPELGAFRSRRQLLAALAKNSPPTASPHLLPN